MTSTLIISDLHLGSGSKSDLLRRPELRESLLEAIEGVDRVVLLGVVIQVLAAVGEVKTRHASLRTLTGQIQFGEVLGQA